MKFFNSNERENHFLENNNHQYKLKLFLFLIIIINHFLEIKFIIWYLPFLLLRDIFMLFDLINIDILYNLYAL